jgi:hypothetical protein
MIYVGQNGLIFRVTATYQDGTPVDLNDAEELYFTVRKPRHVRVERWPAEITSVGTDGQMQYQSTSDDIDEEGGWSIQGWIRMIAGDLLPTTVHNFSVYRQ